MTKTLSAFFALVTSLGVFAQAPVIEGDILLCPDTNGTANVTNDIEYDSYQWYSKIWFETSAEFLPVEGATSESFTYDWYNFDQRLIKVVATLNGETYESNVLQIDSHNWSPLVFFIHTSPGAIADDATQTYLICEGDHVKFTISGDASVFANIQWYKNGEAIQGANQMSYTANTPGDYHLVAARAVCRDYLMTTEENPVPVRANEGCFLNNEDHELAKAVKLYPNPANSSLNITLPDNAVIDSFTIMDITGKTLSTGKVLNAETTINIESLAAGTYMLKLTGGQVQAHKMFIKQ